MLQVGYATALDVFIIICLIAVFAALVEFACTNFIDTFVKRFKKWEQEEKDRKEKEEREEAEKMERKEQGKKRKDDPDSQGDKPPLVQVELNFSEKAQRPLSTNHYFSSDVLTLKFMSVKNG